jgi:hypothetical protein
LLPKLGSREQHQLPPWRALWVFWSPLPPLHSHSPEILSVTPNVTLAFVVPGKPWALPVSSVTSILGQNLGTHANHVHDPPPVLGNCLPWHRLPWRTVRSHAADVSCGPHRKPVAPSLDFSEGNRGRCTGSPQTAQRRP